MKKNKPALIREYLVPERVLAFECAQNTGVLLEDRYDQAVLAPVPCCVIESGGYIILDFGRELSGGVQLITGMSGEKPTAKVRLRLGESAMECCAELGHKHASNDHAIRDAVVDAPVLGRQEHFNSGFRFLRIDNLEEFSVSFLQIKAVYIHRDEQPKGSFSCSDPLLNRIFEVGTHTLHLNTQDYIFDGIKRDRLVWMGDLHPEITGISMLYGRDISVERSLDFTRDNYPPSVWMNDLPAYSLWWIIAHHYWYMYTGDREYLSEQAQYMSSLCQRLRDIVGEDGSAEVGNKFLDWPSSENPAAQDAGVHALYIMAMENAADMFGVLGMNDDASKCLECAKKLKRRKPYHGGNKHSAALAVLAGAADAEEANRELLSVDSARGLSTFLCGYVFRARAMAGDARGALEALRTYYNGMLQLGATSFWEDFDLKWAEGAKPIDSLLKDGEYDVHGDNGAYCYPGYRHSLCHGWSCGFIHFLYADIAGIKVLEPGCKKVSIMPELCGLDWVDVTMPTPLGNLRVSAKKAADGSVVTEIQAPQGMVVEKN